MKRTRQTIQAGKRGTKKLVDKYGPDLLFVRYYYDWENRKRITTAELIADSKKWEPRIPNATIVKVKIGKDEKDLQKKIKARGGKWNWEKGVWDLSFGNVKELGLQSRLVRK